MWIEWKIGLNSLLLHAEGIITAVLFFSVQAISKSYLFLSKAFL